MRILLLNQYFPPDTAATAKMAALVAETLASRHRVTVLAGRPSYEPLERHPPYLLRREVRGNFVVERVGSTTFPRYRMRRRLSNYLSYLALAVPRALTVRSDVILAMTDPPVAGIAGALVARLLGRPFIYNVRDLYPDVAVGGRIVRAGRWVNGWERLHRWALKQASRVIVLGEDMRERVLSKGVDPARVVVIRDGAAIPQAIASRDHPITQQLRNGFDFVVLHAGNLGFYGAWQTLVEAARLLAGDGIGFVFVGDGASRAQVEALASGCPAIRFLPFQPAEHVPHVLAAGDLQVVTVRRGLEGVVVPSKLYPILAAGRPVLAVAPEESDVARIVRRSNCGAVADPDDPSAVAAAVREVYRNRAQLPRMGARARGAARDFDRSRHLKLFLSTVEESL